MNCACPRHDARDCLRVRVGDDMREMLDAPTLSWDDEVCECGCHGDDQDEDYDEEQSEPIQSAAGEENHKSVPRSTPRETGR